MALSGAGREEADLGWGRPVGLPIFDGAFSPDGLGKLICKKNVINNGTHFYHRNGKF